MSKRKLRIRLIPGTGFCTLFGVITTLLVIDTWILMAFFNKPIERSTVLILIGVLAIDWALDTYRDFKEWRGTRLKTFEFVDKEE